MAGAASDRSVPALFSSVRHPGFGPRTVALQPSIAEDLLHGQVGGDPAHATAGVTCGAGLVQAMDRCPEIRVARSRHHVKKRADREPPVEDVAADQAELLLHVVWPDPLAVEDR